MDKPTRCLICDIWIDANYVEPGLELYGKRICGDCLQGAVALCQVLLAHINAQAEADMLKGNPITGAHFRAIEAEQKRLRETV